MRWIPAVIISMLFFATCAGETPQRVQDTALYRAALAKEATAAILHFNPAGMELTPGAVKFLGQFLQLNETQLVRFQKKAGPATILIDEGKKAQPIQISLLGTPALLELLQPVTGKALPAIRLNGETLLLFKTNIYAAVARGIVVIDNPDRLFPLVNRIRQNPVPESRSASRLKKALKGITGYQLQIAALPEKKLELESTKLGLYALLINIMLPAGPAAAK